MGVAIAPRTALSHSLVRRQSAAETGGIVGAVVFVIILCIALLSYFILRRIRIRHDNPRYIPTKYLKKRYAEWLPNPIKKRRASSLMDRRSIQERRSSSPANTLQHLQHANMEEGRNHDGTVDRHASIRSIMTLPSYSADVREHEQVIGREGERAGIDTVVEYPEDEQEEEARREEEMESLYRIRVRRREERTAREERRRLRREARSRNDRDALEALRQESQRARSGGDGSREEISATQLLEEHRNQQRGRRMASVDYAEVGVARHDGSRLRANSNESDRPLLSSAASMSGRNRGLSEPETPPLPNGSAVTLAQRGHAYNQSTSSLSRFTTNAADVSDLEDDASDVEGAGTSYDDRRPSTSRGRSVASGRPSESTASRSIYNAGNGWVNRSSVDLGNYSMDALPRERPPGYEESVRGQSSVDVSRQYDDAEAPDAQVNQSSYSRGRLFGLPKGWGGRKQQQSRDEAAEHEVANPAASLSREQAASPIITHQSCSFTPSLSSAAPPYENPVSEAVPQLPTLTQLPSIEVTPFTPVDERSEHEERN